MSAGPNQSLSEWRRAVAVAGSGAMGRRHRSLFS